MTITETSQIRLRRPKIALAMLGQSNERGQVASNELISGVASRTAYPQAYRSLRKPALAYPISPSVALSGGPLFKIADDLWDWGYDAQIINGSKGGFSFNFDACGYVYSGRSNTTGYRRQRTSPLSATDRGFYGDMMIASSKLFLCTTGVDSYVTYKGLALSDNAGVYELDYKRASGTQATAGSSPDFSTAAVGDTVTDGTVVWTCISLSATYLGYTYSAGAPIPSTRAGFDPYGVVRDLCERLQAADADYKAVYLGNAQSDYNTATYAAAVQNLGSYFLDRGFHVYLGLSMYYPGGATTGQYDTLTAALATAKAALISTYGSTYIHDGANLYTLMGSTGAMASGGAYFAKDSGQDNLHLNAPGAIVAGGYMAGSLKAVLPQLVA